MARKKIKKKPLAFEKTTVFVGKIAAVILFVYVFFQYKPLILIFAFELIDILKNLIKKTEKTIPIDFVFIFGITAAYYYSFFIGLVIFGLGIVNRTVMENIKFRHVAKGWRHILLFFIITYITSIPFFQAAFLMLIINYALKYISYIFSGFAIEKVFFHIANFTLSTTSFYLIHMLYYYFPFLT